jgi:signal peptidase I
VNRDPYGRGDNGDADPYHARRPVADHPGRPAAYGRDAQRRGSSTTYGPGTSVFGAGTDGYGSSSDGYGDRDGYGSGTGGHRRSRRPIEPERRKRPARQAMPLWQELPLLLVVAFCLAVLIRTFLLQAFYIPSGSMEQTLLIGDRVLVNKIIYDVRQPARGEVVVFRGTENWAPENLPQPPTGFFARLGHTIGDLIGVSEPGEKDFIKRVIGLPGDTVQCCDAQGRVTVNDYPLDEPYVTENSPLDVPPSPGECRSRRFGPITIKPGYMFVMGDHRAVSQDARCQGPVPIENVIGRAFVIVWPSKEVDGLPVPITFEKVPRPLAAAPYPWQSGVAPGGTRAVAGADPGTHPVAPLQIDLFVPFVGMLSHRRVRGFRGLRDNVGSAS